MKRNILIILSIIITSIYSEIDANEEKFVVRIQNPTEGMFFKYRSSQYDMPAYKAGEYLDLVVNQDLYNQLIEENIDVSITQSESQLKNNLRGDRDLYGYRKYEDTLGELQEIADQFPQICHLYDLGDTRGKEYSDSGQEYYDNYNHELWGLKLSDNVEIEEDEPGTFFMGLHHSREPISVEVVMGILYNLLDNYGTDPEITYIIDNTQIWFIPIVNPNGHQVVTEEIDLWWRKNIRDNNQNGQFDTSNDYGYGTDGVDPNRNYGFEWGDVGTSDSFNSPVYHGPNAWSEPEIVSMKNLMESHHFVTGITYHSYSELVLFPFGYDMGVTAPDHDALEELAIEMAVTIPSQSGGHYTPQQSLELYPCMGTTDDYAYGAHSIFSFTVELATQFIPPAGQVNEIVEDNLEAAMILLNRVNRQSLTGHITDFDTGDPVVAEIFVDGIDNTGNFKFPALSDLNFGRYYRLLQSGNYDVTFSADGYESVYETVFINPTQQTVLNVSMNPVTMVEVTGQVTDGMIGAPLSGVEVIFNGSIEMSNTEGGFSFPLTYEGTYTVHAELDSYSAVEYSVNISSEDSNVEIELFNYFTETFENEMLSEAWTTQTDAPWYFTAESVFEGDFSIRSGDIDDNENSDLSLDLSVTQFGSIGFHYRVASEYSSSGNYFYDGLEFYINNVLMAQFQPETDGSTPWTYQSFPVPPGDHLFTWKYVKDGGGGSTDMEEDCAWIDLVEFPPTDENNDSMITISPEFWMDWNLVSLSVLTDENDPEILFPNSVDNTLFSFNGEYIGEEELIVGKGYWIRLSSEGPVSFTGYENNEMQISVNEGWNMIGSLSTEINFNEGLIDPNEIIFTSTLYQFADGSYNNVSEIYPGFGFWIRSQSSGDVTLTTNPTSSRRLTPNLSDDLVGASTITINGKTLYFGMNIPKDQEIWYSLPPKFSGIHNDVRFVYNQSYASEIGGEISILNHSDVNDIAYSISENEVWELLTLENGKSFSLVGAGEIELNDNISNIYLNKLSVFADKISVSSAYPNPFNNQTNILIDLPKESYLAIKIYNLKGELVRALLDEKKSAGNYSINWDGKGDHSSYVSSGTYLLQIRAENYNKISKIILLK